MEIIDLIDENGNLTGQTCDRKIVHKEGLLHMASGLIIIKPNIVNGGGYSLLSQQRSYKKDKNAGLWDMTASGHIPSGQKPLESLIREAKEEINLEIDESVKLLGKFWRQEIHNNGSFIENELDFIYILIKDIDISTLKIQEEEVENIKYIPISEFKNKLHSHEAVQRKYVWDALFNYIEDLNKNNK